MHIDFMGSYITNYSWNHDHYTNAYVMDVAKVYDYGHILILDMGREGYDDILISNKARGYWIDMMVPDKTKEYCDDVDTWKGQRISMIIHWYSVSLEDDYINVLMRTSTSSSLTRPMYINHILIYLLMCNFGVLLIIGISIVVH